MNPEIFCIDEPMGVGKSSGVINYLNTVEDDNRYIYITPYKDECKRFVRECSRDFYLPKHLGEFDNSKIKHTKELLKEQKSICTTHRAFELYDNEMLDLIEEGSYILIMDEVYDVMKEEKGNKEEIRLLEAAGYLKKYGDVYKYEGPESYLEKGPKEFRDMCEHAMRANMYCYSEDLSDNFFYYLTPPEALKCFRKIIIMTFMFESSDLCQMLKINGMNWKRLYIKRVDYGNGYMITNEEQSLPDYVRQAADKVHVYEYKERTDGKGRKPKNLNVWIDKSKGYPIQSDFNPTVYFYQRKSKNKKIIKELKNNMRTFFRNMIKEHGGGTELCMWSVYNDYQDLFSQRGYKDQFVRFNERATNDYADRCYCVYNVNIRCNPKKIDYYKKYGIEYSEDDYATSVMVQHIWRSRIRKGEEIWVLLPSKRMRDLMNDFLEKLKNDEF